MQSAIIVLVNCLLTTKCKELENGGILGDLSHNGIFENPANHAFLYDQRTAENWEKLEQLMERIFYRKLE